MTEQLPADGISLPANLSDAIEAIAPRFRSMNRIAIDKATVPAAEWHALVAAILAARAAVDAVGWLPIETAPKDGTEMLLSNGAVVAEGHWLHAEGGITEHRDVDGRYIGQDESDGYDGWIDWSGGMLPEPTHWQPLPKGPSDV